MTRRDRLPSTSCEDGAGLSITVAREYRPLYTWALRGVACLFMVYLASLWIGVYPGGDLDDKAVHYYSAARLFASADHVESLAVARSAWLDALPSREAKFRTDNRLSSYRNYLLPSSLLRVVAEMDRPSRNEPPESFSRPLKAAFLFLYLAGLGCIVGVTWRRPALMVLLLASLTLAGFRPALPWLTARPPGHMSYLVYVPRGSMVLVLIATLAAVHQRKWVAAGSLGLLLSVWHAGSALVAIPLVALSALPTLACARRDRPARLTITAALLAVGIAATCLVAHPLSAVRLWLPLAACCLALILGRQAARMSIVGGITLAAAYLYWAQVLTILLTSPDVLEWIAAAAGDSLIAELPSRLSGATYVVAVVLLLTVGAGLLTAALSKLPGTPWVPWACPLAAVVLLVHEVHDHGAYPASAWRGQCPFWGRDDAGVARHVLSPRTLETLPPQDEAAFFASLGDFMLRPFASPPGSEGDPAGKGLETLGVVER